MLKDKTEAQTMTEGLEHFVGLMLLFLSFLWFGSFPYVMARLVPNEVFIMAAMGIASMWLIGFGFLFCGGLALFLFGFEMTQEGS